MISDFECRENDDVANFLKNKSIRFEESDVARTFLIVDKSNLFTKEEKFRVLGYFSLSMKSIDIPSEIGRTKRKKLDGINRDAENIVCFLIGQLGKHDKYKKDIEGKVVLNHALEMIDTAREIIGKKVALVECEDKEVLRKFYSDNNFEYISKNDETDLLRLVRILK